MIRTVVLDAYPTLGIRFSYKHSIGAKLSQLFESSSVFLPRFGWTSIQASSAGIIRLSFLEAFDEAEANPEGFPDTLTGLAARQLIEYFNGDRTRFEVVFDLFDLPAFQQEVLRLTCTIPYGETRSYGDLARILGSSQDARAVGIALATNPIPIFIPCHRVVSTDGKLRGYSGPGGLETKAWLLQKEGARLIA